MALASSKNSLRTTVFPRSFSIMAASVAILAMFLIFASCLLVSDPIDSSVSVYLYGVNRGITSPSTSTFDQNAEKGASELLTMSSNASDVDKDSLPFESSKEMPTTIKESVDLRNATFPQNISVDSRKNEMPEETLQLSESSSGQTEKKVETSSSASVSNEELPSTKDSVDSRKNEMSEKAVQLSELSSGPTEKKVDISSSASVTNEELPTSTKYSVDSRKKEMPEKAVQLSESSSGPTEKKVDISGSASSNASESNEELRTSPKDSVDSRKNEMPEKPVELSEPSSGATEKKMDSSSSASSNSSKSNEELPISPKDSVDSRKNEMLEKPVELSEPSSEATEKKMDTSSSASSYSSESNEELPTSSKDSVDSRKNEMPEKHVELSEPSYAVNTSSSASSDASKINSVDTGCDLYHGKWFYDSRGPLYTNSSCPIITQMQNCQGNLRPDKEYENWRWKPSQCDLPRFDAKKFLELMRGKTLAFIGDSVARNQMESLLCLLWQVEVPKNRGNRRMHRWFFRSTSAVIVRVWSSWLVYPTTEKFDFAPEGVTKLHLDAPDYGFIKLIPKFDVIIFSSGHWFTKQSVYILNNEIVGGQLWWPDQSRPMKVNNVDAFGISVETILSAMVTHPNYTGLTIVRSFSPDHYEGGAWNTGGSCTGKVKPLATGELVENRFTNIMHEKQVTGFKRAVKKATNKSKLRLIDITKAFEYRHDGHPGPYRSPDPNKITKVGKDGRPPPQDCLHWCMPGAVDTWNELVLEIVRREFEGHQTQR